MRFALCLLVVGFLIGCRTLDPSTTSSPSASLEQAKEHLEAEEFYQARKITEKILKENPDDPDAQKLMAKILDEEIGRHKEIFETRAIENLSPKESKNEAQTWLERSKSLLELKEYDQALEAAENVFLFDPQNAEASKLADKIRKKALKDDKRKMLIRDQTLEAEVNGRVDDYFVQVETAIRQGKWGTAQFMIQKILLLEPENEKALKLRKKIQGHMGHSS